MEKTISLTIEEARTISSLLTNYCNILDPYSEDAHTADEMETLISKKIWKELEA